MKYRTSYPNDGFSSFEEASEWVFNFINWYNTEHYHSALKFMTPSSRHNGETDKIMANRKKLYEGARALNPLRFKNGIRNWNPDKTVSLNPTDEVKENKIDKVI